jgi:hypothetical protein
MARIIICGYMIRHPVAGNVLAFFHYVLGLARLGHDVIYIEESGGWPNPCFDPTACDSGENPGAGMRLVHNLMQSHGLGKVPVWYVHRDTGQTWGATRRHIDDAIKSADLLLNIGGVCWLPTFEQCPRRALIDMDPLFTQIGMFGGPLLHRHQVHFSYGANIGQPFCEIPTVGANWIATVPPVVLDLWNVPPADKDAPFTTIANWGAYGGTNYGGKRYGQKDEEFLRLIDVPRSSPQPLELALSGASVGVRQKFQAAGWSIREAAEVSGNFETYRRYVTESYGEFSAAKNAYVKSRSGWFSDRSVCYLAAGRPVVLQDTGFTHWLPASRGVLAFSSPNEAVQRIGELRADYDAHCSAAREVARRTFAHDVVLPGIVDAAMSGTRTVAAPARGAAV